MNNIVLPITAFVLLLAVYAISLWKGVTTNPATGKRVVGIKGRLSIAAAFTVAALTLMLFLKSR